MRIGVRVTPDRVTGVRLMRDEVREHHSEAVDRPGGLEAALGRLLARLAVDLEDRPTVTVTFEVSQLFTPEQGEPVTVVRIAPRAPMDDAHAYSGVSVAQRAKQTVHVTGGHSNAGEVLAMFEAAALRSRLQGQPPGGRYVVTSVGASVNAAHEIEASRILLDEAAPASVVQSHSFHNTSFSVRERTGVLNSSHLAYAEGIATSLATVAAAHVPTARLFVMTNDGGAAPLASLSLKPVHSLFSGPATEFVGVAAVAGIDDGRIVMRRPGSVSFGEVTAGAPTVVSRSRDSAGELIATRTVHLVTLDDGSVGDWMGEPLEVTVSSAGLVELAATDDGERVELDAGALGAACSQLVEWFEQAVQINNAPEKEQALGNAEAKVRARLVSYGSPPSQVRILDCRVVGASYQNPNVVTVRVRGAAGPSPREIFEDTSG